MHSKYRCVPAQDVKRGDVLEHFGTVAYNRRDPDHPWREVGGEGFEVQVPPMKGLYVEVSTEKKD